MDRRVVLLVDDDAETLQAWRMALGEQSFELLEAGDGQIALDLLNQRQQSFGAPRVDVIVSDWKMPQMDGFALLNAVRENFHAIAFLLISGAMSRDELQLAVRQGADAVLLKPFGKDDLIRKIEEAVFLREAKEVRMGIR